MIQTLIRIAITFQSTRPKASTSDFTPIQTITTSPIRAATVLSTTLLMTAMMVPAKTATASQAMGSTRPSLSRRFRAALMVRRTGTAASLHAAHVVRNPP